MNTLEQYRISGSGASEIGESVEQALRQGRLSPGAALPTVRALAASLAVSPATVAAAYQKLRLRGVITGQGRRGTHVSARPPVAIARAASIPAGLRDLQNGNPAMDLLPPLPPLPRAREPRLYGEGAHLPALVAAARASLRKDGIPADDLAIMGGAMDGVERVLQAHLRPGDQVAVEDPAYSAVLDLLGALGLAAHPMRLDDFGVLPAELRRTLRLRVKACIFTPRAQNPTGAAWNEGRARDLRRLLDAEPGVLVIEDDHAWAVSGTPALTVCHRAKPLWAVVRSVSKPLGPDLRLALLTGDAATVARVQGRQALGAGWVSHILQQTVASLLADKSVARRLAHASSVYSERRNALVDALAAFGIAAHGRSGLNVWVPVPEEAELLAALAVAGWAVRAGERYRLGSGPAIRITVAGLRPADARKLARDLAQALGGAPRRPRTGSA